MATVLEHPSTTLSPDTTSTPSSAPTSAGAPTGADRSTTPASSPMTRALLTATFSVLVVFGVVTAMVMVIGNDVSLLAAAGVGAYASFWLGGGFGLIFGSAAAFGDDH